MGIYYTWLYEIKDSLNNCTIRKNEGFAKCGKAVDRFTYITVCEDSDIFLMQDKIRRIINISKVIRLSYNTTIYKIVS
nr:MAG TPA: hypothetical protein [Caudoviricetes sp.]